MGKLARLPAQKIIQKLKRAGFVETHQRGSHYHKTVTEFFARVRPHSKSSS